MLIDWTRPIETDDGRPAKVIGFDRTSATVSTVGPPHKLYKPNVPNIDKQSFTYSYYTDGGAFCGDVERKRCFGIRNVDDSASFIPEDWS